MDGCRRRSFTLLLELPPGSSLAAIDAYVNGIVEPVYSDTLTGLTATTRAVELDIEASRPVLTVSGVVTENGVLRPGPLTLKVTPTGSSPQKPCGARRRPRALCRPFDLAPGTTTALVEAFVDGIDDPVASDTIATLEPGPNSLDLPGCVRSARVVGDRRDLHRRQRGRVATSPTAISLRRFDGSGDPIGAAQEIDVDPNASGYWTTALDVWADAPRRDRMGGNHTARVRIVRGRTR